MNILVLRLDAIGDYILFRNCLRFLRQSAKYRHAHFTVMGNSAWRDLAETFDADCADEWIWVENTPRLFRLGSENLLPKSIWKDRVKMRQAPYRDLIAQGYYDEIIIPQAFENKLLMPLVEGLSSSILTGWQLDKGGEPFTFLRNRRICSKLTGETCSVDLDLSLDVRVPKDAPILLFDSASHWTKRWPHYQQLGKLIASNLGRRVVIEGSQPMPRRTLSEFARFMAGMKAVVSNDTMALHLAVALGIPVIGITNGISGKADFWPYPAQLGKKVDVAIANARTYPIAGPLGLAVNQLLAYHALSAIKPDVVFERLRTLLA